MAHFTVYTKTVCSFCTAAKGWMLKHGHTYDELNVETDPALMEQMKAKLPRSRTVPQIYFGDYHIGGYTDLKEAEHNGSLSMLLEDLPKEK